MFDVLTWLSNHILPWLIIAIVGGAWKAFTKITVLEKNLEVLTRDTHRITEAIDIKWREVDTRVREDIDDLKVKIDYISRNNVSREELNQYLSQLNSAVTRISNTLDKFL